MNYKETMDSLSEMLILGYSVQETIDSLEESDADEKALNEIKNANKYGI